MPAPKLVARYLKPRVREALGDTPVVLIHGPRQAGKTTLAQRFAGPRRRYLTLDDADTLRSALADPTGFIANLPAAIIDEVQRAPGLLLAMKRAVDEQRRPGRFLLTGSANLMTLPTVADSLAGRMEVLSLLPFAACELEAGPARWLDAIFAARMPRLPANAAPSAAATMQRVLRGGYPEAVARTTAPRRAAWARQYLDALVTRDVRDIAHLEKIAQLPRLLAALGQMAGQVCNVNQLAGQVGLDHKTADKYLAVLEQMFLLRRVAPWSANRLSRVVKAPRIHFLDSGLLASLVGLTEAGVERDRSRFGPLLESYVYGELLKLASWAEGGYRVFGYRDRDGGEVDFVVENAEGRIAGIEVKAAASTQAADFAGLRKLAALAGTKFAGGIVLYDGRETLPMGGGLWAVPLATLWKAKSA